MNFKREDALPESTRLPGSLLPEQHSSSDSPTAASELSAGEPIRVVVNGQSLTIPPGSTVSDVLNQQGVRTDLVAVEVNLEIVPKQTHHQTVLCDGDQMEVVTLVGGG